MQFYPTDPSDPCQVCSDISGKCRRGIEAGKDPHFLCASFEGAIGDRVNGLTARHRSKDASQRWMIFTGKVEKDTFKNRPIAAAKGTKESAEPDATNYGVGAAIRDSQYRKILKSLDLSDRDRQNLIDRGFTPRLIERSLFKTAERQQSIPAKVILECPGVIEARGQKRLNIGGVGFLCPFFDVDGNIVGLQQRRRHPGRSGKGGRYRIVSSKPGNKDVDPSKYPSLKLPDTKENPFTVIRPESITANFVAACEGVGPKPVLLSDRVGAVTIGMPWGLDGSPKTLKKTLDKLATDLGTKVFRYYPDANSLDNEGVREKDRKSLKAVIDLGWRVEIAYWGQGWDKSVGDCDEIPLRRLSGAEILKPLRYFDLKKPKSEAIKVKIKEIVNADLSPSERQLKRSDLFIESGLQAKVFDSLWAAIVATGTESESAAEIKSMVARSHGQSIKMDGFFPPAMATSITGICDAFGSSPETVLVTHLAAADPFIRRGTRLLLKEESGLYAKTSFFSLVGGCQGSAKTPSQMIVMRAVFDIQKQRDEIFEKKLAAWEALDPETKKRTPEPARREFFLSDTTKEGTDYTLSNQPKHGVLRYEDEFVAVMNSFGQYTKGKGSGKQAMLSAKTGSVMGKVNRAGGQNRRSGYDLAYSMTGTIQDEVLLDLMRADNSDGTWSRFFIAMVPEKLKARKRGVKLDSPTKWIEQAYRTMDSWEAQDYCLSKEAADLYWSFWGWADRKRIFAPDPHFKGLYAKAEVDVGTIALITHLFQHAANNPGSAAPPQEVGVDTLRAAIELTLFNISQWKQIKGAEDAEQEIIISHAIERISSITGWVCARNLMRRAEIRRHGKTAEEIRSFMNLLADQGLGRTRGKGAKLEFISNNATEIHVEPGDFFEPEGLPIQKERDESANYLEIAGDQLEGDEEIASESELLSTYGMDATGMNAVLKEVPSEDLPAAVESWETRDLRRLVVSIRNEKGKEARRVESALKLELEGRSEAESDETTNKKGRVERLDTRSKGFAASKEGR